MWLTDEASAIKTGQNVATVEGNAGVRMSDRAWLLDEGANVFAFQRHWMTRQHTKSLRFPTEPIRSLIKRGKV